MVELGELITAMVTPFDGQFQMDLGSAHKLMDHLIRNGSDGILLSGTTGESPTLSDQEKVDLFKFAVENFKGKAKIIAGTGSNDTAHSIEISKEAERLGVDALLLVVPYYNKPSQKGLYRHFEAIASSVKTPVILYNVPSRTSCNLDAETCIQLSKIDNIIGVKEASGDISQASAIARDAEDGFLIYSGNDCDTLPLLSVGGYGVISVASHIAGKEIKKMISYFKQGDNRGAAEIHSRLMDLFKGIFIATNPVPVKKALNLMNMGVGPVRLPLYEMEEAKLNKFKQILKKYNAIS
ncbi:MAG: 4-hydroxy-tetrahydrodipicolinate synthase [Actinomycetota bacterium]